MLFRSANITGHVLDADTDEHLGYVTIQVKGTQIGTTTDATGHFLLTNLKPGEITLTFSMIGFETKEIPVTLKAGITANVEVKMQESTFNINDVVVSANKYETKRREVSTLVNVLSPLTFESTTSTNVADVLDYQSGLRVEMSCSNCGVPQLRINGLSGQYSQILMDNRPIFSSLASVYGLEQVPLGMVDRIEVIRGGGSALFGANAIGGVVNIITKEPVGNTGQVQHTTQLIGGRYNTSCEPIFLVGGVAQLLLPRFKEVFSNNKVTLVDNPQFANAKGYYEIAKMRMEGEIGRASCRERLSPSV